jgi:thioredoxin-like negative regulator of GroEL
MKELSLLEDKEVFRMRTNIVHTSDATFDQDILESSKPVLLHFWAD